MIRGMRFQLSVNLVGITGWIFKVFRSRANGPILKSVLFWKGTLIKLATGFCVAFCKSSVEVPAGGACCEVWLQTRRGITKNNAKQTSMRRCDCIYQILLSFQFFGSAI